MWLFFPLFGKLLEWTQECPTHIALQDLAIHFSSCWDCWLLMAHSWVLSRLCSQPQNCARGQPPSICWSKEDMKFYPPLPQLGQLWRVILVPKLPQVEWGDVVASVVMTCSSVPPLPSPTSLTPCAQKSHGLRICFLGSWSTTRT